jgi:hypothetical protein
MYLRSTFLGWTFQRNWKVIGVPRVFSRQRKKMWADSGTAEVWVVTDSAGLAPPRRHHQAPLFLIAVKYLFLWDSV